MNSLEEIKEILEGCADQQEQLEILMEYGNDLEEFPSQLMIEENKVPGCISNAYITSEVKDNKIYFKGSSEALIVKAYIAILINALSGIKPNEVLNSEEKIKEFLQATNIRANLTPSRANAFENVYGLMKKQAQKY